MIITIYIPQFEEDVDLVVNITKAMSAYGFKPLDTAFDIATNEIVYRYEKN